MHQPQQEITSSGKESQAEKGCVDPLFGFYAREPAFNFDLEIAELSNRYEPATIVLLERSRQ